VRPSGRCLQLVGLLCLCPPLLYSVPIPALSLSELVGSADVIVAGSLLSIKELGTSYAEVGGGEQMVHLMTATVEIGEVLKGSQHISAVTLRWILPEESNGYAGVPAHVYRLMFLRRSGSGYGLASVYYPTLPAIPGIQTEGTTALDRVITQLAAVVRSAAGSSQDRIEAINALDTVENAAVASTLRGALLDKNKSVQLRAASALLEHNDISALRIAEDVLRGPRSNLPEYLFHNLLYGISVGIKDERAIPTL
jgi:hypothetical protein